MALQRDRRDVEHTVLYRAVALDDVDVVRNLLEKGASICEKKEGEMTPLCLAMRKNHHQMADIMLSKYNVEDIVPGHPDVIKHFLIACERDHLEAMTKFVRQGISVNSSVESTATENPGFTPLHFAVQNTSLKTVKFLRTAGADPNIPDKYGRTALELAYRSRAKYLSGNLEGLKVMDDITDMLIALGLTNFDLEQDNRRPLSYFHIACTRNNAALASLFLLRGVNIQRRAHDDLPEVGGYSGLHFAVQHNCAETVELLIREGVDVNARSTKGWTPLNVAISKEDLSLVPLVHVLLTAGADLSCKTPEGMTALHMAFLTDNDEIIEPLLQHDPKNINPSNRAGLTHFHIACTISNMSHLETYLANYPDNIVDLRVSDQASQYPGYTGLHFAVHFDEPDVLNRLLQSRANVNARDAQGRTALYLACEYGCSYLVEILLRQGADVNAQDSHGATVICFMLRENDRGFNKHVFEAVRLHLQLIHLLGRNVSRVLIDTYSQILRKHHRSGISNIDTAQAVFECDLEHDERASAIRKELRRLRQITLDPYTTAYDMLHKNAVRMMTHCRNKAFRDLVEREDLTLEYPCYGELLKFQYVRGTGREQLLAEAKDALSSSLCFGLPDACLECILKYFGVDEIRMLLTDASLVQELKRRQERTNYTAVGSGDFEPMIKNLRLGRNK